MGKVSVLIPSRGERFLVPTVRDVLANAWGDIEVIVALDGYTCALPDDPRIKVIRHEQALGMRACINHAAQLATGEYLLKCDAHVLFAEGYDEVLKADCETNWMVVPRRYSLDAENWTRRLDKSPIDAHYLSYPYIDPHIDTGLHGVPWSQRTRERAHVLIDEEMSTQGSVWFMYKAHWERIGGMDEGMYGKFYYEPQELGLKTWLSGGAMMCNKRTWYSHLFKGKRYGRGYSMPHGEREKYTPICTAYWMGNQWPQLTRKFEWLVEKFWPIPTWSEGWQARVHEAH